MNRSEDPERRQARSRSRLRVLVYAPTGRGGHPDYVFALLSAAQRGGAGLHITWPIEELNMVERRSGANFELIPTLPAMPERAVVGRVRWFAARVLPWRRHDTTFVLWLIRRREQFDCALIEEHQRFTLILHVILLQLFASRIVVHLHNLRRHDYRGTWFDRLDLLIMGAALRKAHAVVVHSTSMARILSNRHGIRSGNVHVVPHGVDGSVSAMHPKTKTGSGPVRLLFFGVNRPGKGLDVLVRAFLTLPSQYELMVIGHTPEDYHRTTSSLLENEPRISWLNQYVDPEEISLSFSRAELVVLPYTSFEAQSGVLHLAIEQEVPVVVSDIGALSDTVKEFGLGLVVPHSQPEALSAAITQACEPLANSTFRLAARKAKEHLDWSEVSRQFTAVLSGALED